MENEDITNGRKLDTACVSVTHGQFPAKIRGSTDAEARAVNWKKSTLIASSIEVHFHTISIDTKDKISHVSNPHETTLRVE